VEILITSMVATGTRTGRATVRATGSSRRRRVEESMPVGEPGISVDGAVPGRARVVLIGGPSGSGKSRLAASSGLPVLKLDDFYRSGDEDGLPRLPGGQVDWDDPGTWHADAALAAIESLCSTGRAEVPVYDLSQNGPTGLRTLTLDGAKAFVAEGIFVAELIGPAHAAGLLERAICLRRSRRITFALRLLRDLREHRKPPAFLLRRGIALARTEPAAVQALVAAGCEPLSMKATTTWLHGLAGG
jgi:uridine kinase